MSKNKQTPKLTNIPTSISDIEPTMTAIEEKEKERIAELETTPLPPEPIRIDATPMWHGHALELPPVEPLNPGQLRGIYEAAGHLPPMDEDADLEFAAVIVKFQEVPGPLAKSTMIDQTPGKTVEGFLNDGWQIDDHISSPPFALIIFSREREEVEEGAPQDEQ
jgi:hypothetical protein